MVLVCHKLKAFFEKYFGIGGPVSFSQTGIDK